MMKLTWSKKEKLLHLFAAIFAILVFGATVCIGAN
jgi:preprotein translocase subunit SecE